MTGGAGVDRAALARTVLARAEERTGTRRSPWQAGRPDLRADPHGRRPDLGPVRSALPVAGALSDLLPDGMVRGAALTIAGSTSLLLASLAEASAAGAWIALAGLPSVGVLAAHQSGLDLTRVVLVPDPGPDGPRVLAALVDGVDVVVVGRVALVDADRHRLGARARERGAVLVSTSAWPGSAVVLTAEGSRWSGVGRGDGRLTDRVLGVHRAGRGSARPARFEVRLPGCGGSRVDLAAAHGPVLELDRRAG